MNAPIHSDYGAVLRARTHVSGNDFASLVRGVWRRKSVPLLGFLVGAAIGLAGLLVTPPLYSASARIMIGSHGDGMGMLRSEMEIIESTPVLSKVAGVLNLYKDHRFTKPNILETAMHQDMEENAVRDRVLRRLAGMVHVSAVEGTNIIDMTVRHPVPDRAAQIANVVLSSYQERKNDERFEQSRQFSAWMGKHLEEIKAQAEDARKKLEDFQVSNSVVPQGMVDTTAERAQNITKEIERTHAQIASLEARLVQEAKRGGKFAEPRGRLKALEAQLAEMATRYGEKHPKILGLKAEIARVRSASSGRTGALSDTQKQIDAAKDRLLALRVQVNDMAADYDTQSGMQLKRRTLESEVLATQHLYENMAVKYQDLQAQTEWQDGGMKVVSMATIPSKPDQMQRFLVVLLLGGLGFLGGLAAVFIRVLWSTGFNTLSQLENMTGYPVFATIPAVDSRGSAVHHSIIKNPAALLAESLRSLRVSLRLRTADGVRRRVIAMTSTLPSEGKTSLAVMLAIVAAKSGERVIVVDCDLRRPSLHKAFGIGNARGLQDYLSDKSGLDETIYRKDPSGVHLITTKAVPSYSLTLLTSGRMEKMIANLREQYDLVILDTPSSLAFADSRLLAHMVDQTLYVVAWNKTRRDSAIVSLKAYADMGYTDLALVLNKVNLEEYLRDSASAVIYQYGQESGEAFPHAA